MTPLRSRWLAGVAVWLCCTACSIDAPPLQSTPGDPPPDAGRTEQGHVLWALKGRSNTVYLMGSVHALREQDYPLPAALLAAYEDAETLVMELPLNDLDAASMAATMQARGFFEQGTTLREWLGPENYATASAKSAVLGISLSQFNHLEPWLAALTILNVQMAAAGYSPDAGVEAYFASLARQDGKKVLGLETLDEQLQIFDSLSRREQIQLLLNTLDDASELDQGLDTLVTAWRQADTDVLELELKAGFVGLPAMYEELVVRRNRKWLSSIEAFTEAENDHLVIVGAMHLVGSDSVIALLEQQGYRVRKL